MILNTGLPFLSKGDPPAYDATMKRTIATINMLNAPTSVKIKFHKFVDRIYRRHGIILLGYEGQRAYERQWDLRKKYLAGGNKASAPGYSWHNFGRAIDFVPVNPQTGAALWKSPDWQDIVETARREGISNGRSFGDTVHFWIPDGTTLAKERQANPGWEKYGQMEAAYKKDLPKDVTNGKGGGNAGWWIAGIAGGSLLLYFGIRKLRSYYGS